MRGSRLPVPLEQLGRPLTAAEAVGVIVAIGGELAALHATGRGHGAAEHVAVDARGAAFLLQPATGGEPADDVRALARRVESCVGPSPELLRRLLASARCTDPAGRPGAAELVDLARRVTRPLPVTVPSGRVPARWASAVPVALLGLALAIALGRASAGGPSPPASLPSSVGPTSSAISSSAASSGRSAAAPVADVPWAVVLLSQDRARARAWASGTRAALAGADVAGGPAYAHDVRLVTRLRGDDLRAHGWAPRIERVVVVGRTGRRVVLRVLDRLPSYVLTQGGVTVRRAPARGRTWWRIELRRVEGGWRTWSVAREGE